MVHSCTLTCGVEKLSVDAPVRGVELAHEGECHLHVHLLPQLLVLVVEQHGHVAVRQRLRPDLGAA
jgi:hypothetical protein